MRLTADSYFTIGNAHLTAGKPCQDFSLTGTCGEGVCAVVSDGCSTGGRTDIGARIVALGTLEAVRNGVDRQYVDDSVQPNQNYILNCSRDLLGLDKSDLLATCAYARVDNESGHFKVQGDGVIAVKMQSGMLCMSRFEWENNTPYYPAYEANGDLSTFQSAHGGPDAEAMTIERWVDGELHMTQRISVRNAPNSIYECFITDKVDFAAVFSDGVTQIDGVDWKDAVRELLNFKNTTGEFAKRRMIRYLKDIKAAGSKGPVDDISFAVVHIDHESDN